MNKSLVFTLPFIWFALTGTNPASASIKIGEVKTVVDTLFYESFNTNEGTGGNDSTWSGMVAYNSITSDNDGWTFTSGHGACRCAKFGTTSEQGIAVTPQIDLTGALTDTLLLTFYAGAWDTSSEKTSLSITTSQGSLLPQTVTLTKGAFTRHTLKFIPSTYSSTRITFKGSSTNGRFFLDEVTFVHPMSILVGDTNRDGNISISDIPTAITIWGKEQKTPYETAAADVDGEEGITSVDIEFLADKLLGKDN